MSMTVRQSRARGTVHAMLGTLALALVLVLACAPSRALAADAPSGARPITVTQSLSESGSIPASLDTTFTYELKGVDSAPLPRGAQGDTYTFTMDGTTSHDVALSTEPVAPDGGIAYSRVGVYTYQLRCVTDASGTPGMTVDDTAWEIQVAIENDDNGGLKVGWVTIKNLSSGDKLDDASFNHSFKGADPAQGEPQEGPTIFGIKLPQTSDASWGLIQLSAVICVLGIAALMVGISQKRKERKERGQ